MRRRNTFAIILLMIMIISSIGCTKRSRARRFGGTETIKLDANQKLVTVTWKDSELWYLTRPAKPGEVSETYTFKEDSKLGIIEGTVILKEHIVK